MEDLGLMRCAKDVVIWFITASAKMLGHAKHIYHEVPVTCATNQSEKRARSMVTHARANSRSAAVA